MNNVTKILNIKYPIIQAPMSWMTNARLVATVSNAGGLGILGPNAGQTEITSDPKETASRMRDEIHKVKTLTNKSFGLNILTPRPNERLSESAFTNELLQMAFDEEIEYFAVVGTAHKEVFEQIKQHNGKIIFRPLTPTVEQMKLGESYGADIAVATGSDEGGILPDQEFGTFTIVPSMVDAVNIPVLAAGGINDNRSVRAAFSLGAQGVYVGSRFLMTEESPLNNKAKDLVLKSDSHDVIRVSPTQRAIKLGKALEYSSEVAKDPFNNELDREISRNGGLRPGMLMGDFKKGIVSVNTGIGSITTVPSVAKLIEQLMA